MKVIYPPNKYPHAGASEDLMVFLAGSIEMGQAIDWQQKFIDAMGDKSLTVLNPRRKDWDSTWKQDPSNPQFLEQVQWELNGLHMVDTVFFYFAPGTMSPISLLELGLMLNNFGATRTMLPPLYVCCPREFWRWANVKITCDYADKRLSFHEDLDEAIAKFKADLEQSQTPPTEYHE